MIRYYAGVEGSGKTCMMTRDLHRHYGAGGRVLAFPGYELYGRNKNQVLSELMFPEQILELLDGDNVKEIRAMKIAIAIDEVLNFFNHHNWYNKINDILYAVLAERRKLGLALLMTGPEYEKLPPDIRGMIHEIIRCWDAHSFNRKEIPVGVICKYYKEDRRGLLSHPRYRFSRRRKFYMKPWYRHYDTYAAVNSLHQFLKLRFQGREILVGPDGKPIEPALDLDVESFDGMISKYNPVEDPRVTRVKQVVSYLREKGKMSAEASLILEMLGETRLDRGVKGVGRILNSLGAIYNRNKKIYDLSGALV